MGAPYAEVIGDPIGHSRSPLIHNFWLEKLGRGGTYRSMRVALDELPTYFANRRADPGWRGCNVTMPHKQAVLPFLDDLMEEARDAGAVNTIVRAGKRLIGHNSDVLALRHDVAPAAQEAAALDLPMVLFGAGGAARAVLQAVRDVEGISVAIVNRDQAKAEALLASFGLPGTSLPLGAPLPATTLIVNASSLGMEGFPPLPVRRGDLSGLVYDLVYAPPETGLLRLARSRGLATLDGLHMLIEQARFAFQYFFSFVPPTASDGELRELLAA
jgi:shikimate dehydrogenase